MLLKKNRLLTVATLLALASCAILNAKVDDAASTSQISAADPHFLYEGRFDTSDASSPTVIWQGSRIRIDFEGDSLALRFDDVKGQVFFNAQIDGRTHLVALRQSVPAEGTEFSNLGAGHHQLVLFKRSEAAAGTVRFRGIILAKEAHLLAPTAPHYPLAMQFFGDSITVGACNEDGATDQWGDRLTHNNAQSYGAFTASAFDADYRNIAISGMGIVSGYVPMKAGEIWDRVYPNADSPRADLTTWTPDVIFVNLGENDDSFTKVKGQPFPADAYTDGYVSLVHAIRVAYANAQIVILRGGMSGGAQSERLRQPWEAAVAKLEASDPHVTHFVFKQWSPQHPRVSEHRAMADELIAWLKTQAFMKARNKR